MKPYRKGYSVGFLCIVFTNLFAVITPLVLKFGIEDLQQGVTASKIAYYSGIIVIIALFAGIFRYFMRRVIVSVSRRIEFDMRIRYFAHLQVLSPSFYNRQQTGDLMTRATSDIEAVRMVFGPAVMYSVDTLLTAAFALSVMFALSVPLTLTVLTLAPILSTLIYFLAKNILRFSLQVQERYSDLNAMIQEHLSGVRVVRSYCQEDPEKELFHSLNNKYFKANMKLVKIQAMLFPLFYSIFGVGMALILYMGGRAIISGTISLGDFVAYSAYVSMLAWPVMAIGWILNMIQRGSASMRRIVRIMDIKPEISDQVAGGQLRDIIGNIRFENVTFSYPDTDTDVLEKIDLDIPAGSSLGIVGYVGSGKTTLLSLIPRLYEVSSGKILIDDVPVEEIPLDVLRKELAIVPQDSFLFSDKLERNVLFADREYEEGDLLKYASASGIDEDVKEFPDGYDVWVGERGITLSGGQKQRTSLARALSAEPKILLLDDCFSAVDTSTEADVINNISSLLKGKTILIVAHRISTLQWADQIIVLHEGKITERGNHDKLLKIKGKYAELYHKQLLEAELR
ncbi:ABC transporter [candidate division LCP-89 bacterium B3_LCP]|uniref:ABC transporter n=1 Tax=candidate division LCP-89 bacterium B3_LCP TaxID=2012998 RepID=A0A532UXN9_UNCL8|nr:MAG: ABC transporter [candidate division LCP-89 bacterium B3_LCP]